ncbi:hypothetical protein C4573_06655 [Candidatus Woesearchaeota archaeon]|nr:MAG: hypothetical protein C4573_06655 [Candidatus Woesearchaeota archaeon]
MEGKRGISPLIATLLLIAFTVALGVMIMNWGRNIVDDFGECESVKLVVDSVPNSVCYNTQSQTLDFTLLNNGKTDVSSIILRSTNFALQGNDRKLEFTVDGSSIAQGRFLVKQQPYLKPEQFKLEFIPTILVNNKETLCTEKAIEVVAIPNCG